jgi:hypothetical protein
MPEWHSGSFFPFASGVANDGAVYIGAGTMYGASVSRRMRRCGGEEAEAEAEGGNMLRTVVDVSVLEE